MAVASTSSLDEFEKRLLPAALTALDDCGKRYGRASADLRDEFDKSTKPLATVEQTKQRAAAALGDVAAKIGELAQTFDRYLDAQLRELDRSVAETSVLSQQFAIMYETVAREAINDLQPAASGQLRAKTTKGSLTHPVPPERTGGRPDINPDIDKIPVGHTIPKPANVSTSAAASTPVTSSAASTPPALGPPAFGPSTSGGGLSVPASNPTAAKRLSSGIPPSSGLAALAAAQGITSGSSSPVASPTLMTTTGSAGSTGTVPRIQIASGPKIQIASSQPGSGATLTRAPTSASATSSFFNPAITNDISVPLSSSPASSTSSTASPARITIASNPASAVSASLANVGGDGRGALRLGGESTLPAMPAVPVPAPTGQPAAIRIAQPVVIKSTAAPAAAPPPLPAVKMASVIHTYNAEDSDEITINQGETVEVINPEVEGGWMYGKNVRGQIGIFPAGYVKLL